MDRRGYRRIERRCLERLLERTSDPVVLAAGGGIVNPSGNVQPAARQLLHGVDPGVARRAHVAWIVRKAISGRWMGTKRRWQDSCGHPRARASRFYGKADAIIDTSGGTLR